MELEASNTSAPASGMQLPESVIELQKRLAEARANLDRLAQRANVVREEEATEEKQLEAVQQESNLSALFETELNATEEPDDSVEEDIPRPVAVTDAVTVFADLKTTVSQAKVYFGPIATAKLNVVKRSVAQLGSLHTKHRDSLLTTYKHLPILSDALLPTVACIRRYTEQYQRGNYQSLIDFFSVGFIRKEASIKDYETWGICTSSLLAMRPTSVYGTEVFIPHQTFAVLNASDLLKAVRGEALPLFLLNRRLVLESLLYVWNSLLPVQRTMFRDFLWKVYSGMNPTHADWICHFMQTAVASGSHALHTFASMHLLPEEPDKNYDWVLKALNADQRTFYQWILKPYKSHVSTEKEAAVSIEQAIRTQPNQRQIDAVIEQGSMIPAVVGIESLNDPASSTAVRTAEDAVPSDGSNVVSAWKIIDSVPVSSPDANQSMSAEQNQADTQLRTERQRLADVIAEYERADLPSAVTESSQPQKNPVSVTSALAELAETPTSPEQINQDDNSQPRAVSASSIPMLPPTAAPLSTNPINQTSSSVVSATAAVPVASPPSDRVVSPPVATVPEIVQPQAGTEPGKVVEPVPVPAQAQRLEQRVAPSAREEKKEYVRPTTFDSLILSPEHPRGVLDYSENEETHQKYVALQQISAGRSIAPLNFIVRGMIARMEDAEFETLEVVYPCCEEVSKTHSIGEVFILLDEWPGNALDSCHLILILQCVDWNPYIRFDEFLAKVVVNHLGRLARPASFAIIVQPPPLTAKSVLDETHLAQSVSNMNGIAYQRNICLLHIHPKDTPMQLNDSHSQAYRKYLVDRLTNPNPSPVNIYNELSGAKK
jgi:hypothetical protein